MVRQTTLISHALSFASFLLDSNISKEIRKIILFGSVARGDYSGGSDIDLFVDAPEKAEKEILKALTLFYSSEANKRWRLKGIAHDISLKVGNLAQWKLRREVISSGILLYGKYNELPESIGYYVLFRLESIVGKKASQQMKIWRGLYGYTQKVGKKVYYGKGLVAEVGGVKLGKAVFLVPMEKRKPIIDFLRKHHVRYSLHELWSDAFPKDI